MEIKEAIKTAKAYVSHLFTEEGGRDYTLEEVEFKEIERTWRVTVGFARPVPIDNSLGVRDFTLTLRRAFKVVEIDDTDAQVLSVRDRERTN